MTRRMMISALTSVLILVVLVTSRGQSVSNVVYHDPQHRFTVKVPDGWTVDTPGKVVFKRGKNVVVVNPSADSLQRLVQGLKLSPSAVLTALQKSADVEVDQWRKAFPGTSFSETKSCSFAGVEGLCVFISGVRPDGKRITVKEFTGRELSNFLIVVDERSAVPEVCEIERSFSPGKTPASADIVGCVAEYTRVLQEAERSPSSAERTSAAAQRVPRQGESSTNMAPEPPESKHLLEQILGEAPSTGGSEIPAAPQSAANSHTGQAGLGIVSLAIVPVFASQIGLAADSGLLIQSVLPGSAADRADLRGGTQSVHLVVPGNENEPRSIMLGGDLIIAIDDQPIKVQQDATRILSQHRPGDRVIVTIYRGNQKMQVPVTLGEAPSPGGRAVLAGNASASKETRVTPNAFHWHYFYAPDRTFGVNIPQEWSIARGASWSDFRVFSREGEFLRAGKGDVFPDEQSRLAMIQLFQLLNANGPQQSMAAIGAPPEMVNLIQTMHAQEIQQQIAALGLSLQDIELFVRAVLPPYSPPVEIIRTLLPQIGNGAIQNMQILKVRNIAMSPGFRGALIHYQYVLRPRQDPAFAAWVAPSLMNYPEVRMRGLAIVYTLPPSGAPLGGYLGALNTWHYLHLAVEAPEPVFMRSTLVYDQIFQSYTIYPAAVEVQGQAWMNLLASMHEAREKAGHQWLLALGGLAEGNTASNKTPRLIDITKSCPIGHLRQCQDGIPRCYVPLPPGMGCEEVHIIGSDQNPEE